MKNILLLLVTILTGMTTLAHVQINNPSGGETFFPGDTVNIQWQELATHATENYDLYFSPDGGVNWDIIVLDINPNHRDYDWVVPAVTTDKGSVRVVQDNEGTDYSDDCGYFTIMGTSGIFDQPVAPSFSVFPNPATDRFSIELDANTSGNLEQLRIINYLGQTMYERKLEQQPGDHSVMTINTSLLPEGIYYVVLNNDVATETRKLIISR